MEIKHSMESIILEHKYKDPPLWDSIETIIHEVIDKIPTNPKLNSHLVRRRLFERVGPKAFLDPIQLKYPIVDPDDVDEHVHPNQQLLTKAFYELNLSNTLESKELITNIQMIMDDNKYTNNIFIRLEGVEELLELSTLLYYLG